MTISAFPLQWPTGWKRTQPGYRRNATFTKYKKQLAVYDGVQRVLEELQRLGIGRDDLVISTNIDTRMDGLPRSDRSEPGDPGVAVYWQEKKGSRKVMAIDHYSRVADNLAAISATLEAMRAIERHGRPLVWAAARTALAQSEAQPVAIPWQSVVQAIDAVGDEARRRGAMFPQTGDEQAEDRAAVHRVNELIQWYATQGGGVAEKLDDWPKLAASPQEAQPVGRNTA